MALDPRKRQKKIEKRKAKQRDKHRELAMRRPQSISDRLAITASAPILHCYAMAEIWQEGIGQVFLSRQLNNGQVAFASFLVDIYCLGVKDAVSHIAPQPLYKEEFFDKMARQSDLIKFKPECARKLVEGAVQYAHDLGLTPHPDYHKAKKIFGDISAADCSTIFEYGQDGKPFFISGPDDDPARCRYIINTLRTTCGDDGFHYVLPVGDLDSLHRIY
jgi:hypothetical protein